MAISILNAGPATIVAEPSDLPYALVEPGEWEFSGSGVESGVVYTCIWSDSGGAYNLFADGVYLADYESVYDNLTEITFQSVGITATRPSLPGHLLDRSGNRVVVSGDTTLTLPALVNTGKSRDFYIKLSLSSGASVSFVASSGESAPSFIPASPNLTSGVWHFTEVVAGTYSITECGVDYAEILGDIETALHTINNGSTT